MAQLHESARILWNQVSYHTLALKLRGLDSVWGLENSDGSARDVDIVIATKGALEHKGIWFHSRLGE